MFAMIREGTSDPEKLAELREQAEEFWRIRAQQPGYQGSVTVGTGHATVLIVTFWETQEHAEAAGVTLEPVAQRLIGPMWTTPPRVVASGPVVHEDLPRA